MARVLLARVVMSLIHTRSPRMSSARPKMVPVNVTVNSVPVSRLVEPRLNLVDFLRADLGLTGTQTPYRIGAQCYAELVLDELGHRLAGPQRKHELQ